MFNDHMFNNHLMKVCLAAVLALGLAACSSSDNDPASTGTGMEETPDEQELAKLREENDRLQQQIDDAEEEDRRKAAEAAVATAAKLYAGISAPVGDAASPADGDRAAAYNTAGTAIMVSSDAELTTTGHSAAVTLSEDEDTMVAANHGWAGKRYADPAGGDTVEAYVYSDVKAPTQGRKFGSAAAVTASGAYEYQLTGGVLANATTAFVAGNVAFTGVTRTAGTETFNLPNPNPTGADIILIDGSYHGVSGTYNCTPATPADGCSAAVAAEGFTVSSGDTWTFTPDSAEARVMDRADTAYASYGWWLVKAENDGPFTASAFVDEVGDDDVAATGLDALNGTATYVGGAAGKYALASSTGGTNDAGHFTARATLEADFTNNTEATAITGTIDMFIGADGQSRDWEIELMGSAISDIGGIGDATDGTAWTIGGTAADESGQWSGTLRNNGDDLVPQVATGTFYTEYGTAGRMVGAFGANKQ